MERSLEPRGGLGLDRRVGISIFGVSEDLEEERKKKRKGRGNTYVNARAFFLYLH